MKLVGIETKLETTLIDHQRERAQRNGFIERSFRDTADRDYIAARMCFRLGLTEQFLWLSLQSIEKYLKAILLFNNKPTQHLQHNLLRGLRESLAIQKLEMNVSARTSEFVEYVSEQGPNRYFVHPRYTRKNELLELDRAVWDIRRYCQDFFFPEGHEGRKKRLEAYFDFVRSERCEKKPSDFRLYQAGFIEEVLKGEKHKKLYEPLTWKNLLFGRNQKYRVRIKQGRSWSRPNNFIYPNLKEWLKTNVYIPKSIMELMDQQFREK